VGVRAAMAPMVRARGVLVGSTSSNTELEAQGVEIRQRRASDNGSGAQRFGDAPAARKYVEATNDIVNHVADHELWYTLEREAMKRGTEALLDCTDGALDFANGPVSGHDIHHKGKEVGADALKLMVCMNIANGKPRVWSKATAAVGSRRMVLWVRLGTYCTVRKPISREIVCRKQMPWTKKKSAHRVSLQWCASTGAGMGTASKVGARGTGEERVILPLTPDMKNRRTKKRKNFGDTC
jgi:hypothetical protein